MKHWTQESVADFAYSLSLDFFTQLEGRLEESEINRKEYAEKLGLTAGRVSQLLNDPPENPQLETLVRHALAVGMKLSVVAYDDNDPENNNGPIISEVFSRSWEMAGKPRDLAFLDTEEAVQFPVVIPEISQIDFYRPLQQPFPHGLISTSEIQDFSCFERVFAPVFVPVFAEQTREHAVV